MTETREDIEKWAALPDEGWVAAHVPRFTKVRPAYAVSYEEFLKAVLKQACDKLAPLAIVEARTKGIASFAEKILRKRKIYVDPKDPLPPDPLVRMTDLCGGRVITRTSDQVHAVCEFIEQAFIIDWPNSEDVSRRLKPTEFGYRSVHYIVQVDPDKLKAAGITATVPTEILGLKAEIQVRTLLEHAWADIGHEMTYKTELKVPDNIHRQFASIAAVLESADREFGRLVHSLDEFKSNYGGYHTRNEVQAEIARLRIVLTSDSQNIDLAVKIGQLALSIGEHELALNILQPYVGGGNQGVQRVRGIALTEMHWDNPRSKEYLEGCKSLEAACAHAQKDAETLCALAETWAYRRDDIKARDNFHKAVAVDATEPVTLSRYIEFEIAHLTNDTVISLTLPMIRNAMERCRKQIEARINLPRAWASLAILHLFVGEPFEALGAVAQVIRLCDPPDDMSAVAGVARAPERFCAAGRALLRILEALERIKCICEKLSGFDWCQRAVLLGLAVRVKDAESMEKLQELGSWQNEKLCISPDRGIVILSGGCVPEVQSAIDALKPHMLKACEGLDFTLISGGTTSGISGLAGDIAAQSDGNVRAFGYLPRLLPHNVKEDENLARYFKRFSSPGSDFTPLDPLQGWTDIITAGIDPRRVKLISYVGGQISRCEYVMALALGARVAVLEDMTLSKDRQFNDPDWQDHPNLVRLPMDSMTLRAFLLVDELPCKRDEFTKAAQKTHEEYVKSAIPKEPSLLPWKDLPESLKISNYHQIAYAENILKTVGLGIRPIVDPAKSFLKMTDVIGEDEIRCLAEMEHGRWNIERLLLGWRYAESKDVLKKQSPYLVPWDQLPANIRKFDLDGICSLPKKLWEAGLEVYLLKGVGDKGRKG